MSGVNYHAHTHRPKAQGGTDPLTLGGTYAHRYFGGVWNFSTGYPNGYWDWQWLDITYSDPAYFASTDESLFFLDDTVDPGFPVFSVAQPGSYAVAIGLTLGINGFWLDLPPSSGAIRIIPGNLLTGLYLKSEPGYSTSEQMYSWTEDDYTLSAHLGIAGGLGNQRMSYAAQAVYPEPVWIYPVFESADALSDDGAAGPELPPTCGGIVQIATLAGSPY